MSLRLYLPYDELEVNLGHLEKNLVEKEKGGREEGKKRGSRGRKV